MIVFILNKYLKNESGNPQIIWRTEEMTKDVDCSAESVYSFLKKYGDFCCKRNGINSYSVNIELFENLKKIGVPTLKNWDKQKHSFHDKNFGMDVLCGNYFCVGDHEYIF
jgi:hypothetical protein